MSTPASAATPFEAALRAELVAGIERHERRRRRRRAVARRGAGMLAVLVAVAAAVVGVLPGSLGPDPVQSEPLHIVRAEGAVVVKVGDLEADPDAIRRQLREAGLGAVEIDVVPAAPHQVGRFMRVGGMTPTFESLNGPGPEYTSFVVTPGVAAEGLTLLLGREPRPGEAYSQPVDAFGPHGPLHCSVLWNARVADALGEVERLGLDARWDTIAPQSDVDPHTIPDHRIAMAALTGPNQIVFMTSPGPVEEHTPVKPPDTSACPAAGDAQP